MQGIDEKNEAQENKKPVATGEVASGFCGWKKSSFRFVFEHLAAAVKAIGADVVAQVDFTSFLVNCNAGNVQGIVRAVHSAFGRRFFILLNGHGGLLDKEAARLAAQKGLIKSATSIHAQPMIIAQHRACFESANAVKCTSTTERPGLRLRSVLFQLLQHRKGVNLCGGFLGEVGVYRF